MKKIFLLTTILAGSLFSATFNVSTTPELRTALSTASTNGEDDTIILADGTYKTTDDGLGTFIYLSNEANSLTLQGSSADNVILSGDNTHQILNHQSTVNAPMTLEKLSFIDGNNTSGYGGGVYTDYSLKVVECKINNNKAENHGSGGLDAKSINIKNTTLSNNISKFGGSGFSSYGTTIIENTIFLNNISTSGVGGGFYSSSNSNPLIKNTKFINNSAKDGGGFYADHYSSVQIQNSEFINNTASNKGGGFFISTHSSLKLINSNIINNRAINGGSFYAESINVINSLLSSNDSGIYISNGENNIIYNSIFNDNIIYDIKGTNGVILSKLNNNYINISNLDLPNFNKNNIFDGVNLGFLDEVSGDYRLTSSSDLINVGTNDLGDGLSILSAKNCQQGSNQFEVICDQRDGSFLHTSGIIYDFDGNARLVGGSVDIGPYEFSSTKPTINSFTYTGTAKELSQLTFNVDYTLKDDGRYINEVAFDYLNDGKWTSTNTHTFSTAGTYTVRVKVTDSQGEFSIKALSVTISALAFTDMTDAQKLVKAIDSTYYNQIVAIINNKESTATTSGIATGESNVTSNPTNYGLITQTQSNNLVSLAQTSYYNDGLIAGKQYVQNNLAEFNLVTKTASDTAIASAITSGIATGIATGEANVKTNPSTFGLITIADKDTAVVTATNTALASGKKYVQDNLTEFNLVTKTDKDTAVRTATNSGIATGEANVKSNPSTFGLITLSDKETAVSNALENGKQSVLLNPSLYGLELKEPLTKTSIDSLKSGWHNISNPAEITDLTIFDSASIVWIFSNTSNSWEAYSSNPTYKTKIKNSSDIKLAEKIDSNVGIWVLK